MSLFLAGSATGALVVGMTVYMCIRWQLLAADDAERRARAIRDEAAQIEAVAERHERFARALITPTSEYQVVRPAVRVRVGAMLTDIRDWAVQLGPDRSQCWAEGELKQLAERPPLRTKSLPARKRPWIFPDSPRLPKVTPLVMSRLPFDHTRIFRTTTVRTS